MWPLTDKIQLLKKLNRKSIILNSLPFVLAGLIFILIKLSFKNPMAVESLYQYRLYPVIKVPLSWFSSLFPFALGDIFYTIALLALGSGLVAVVIRKLRVKNFIFRTLQSIAILYSAFYLLWGFNYFRPDIGSRIGWQKYKSDEIFFRQILDTIIIASNSSYTTMSEKDYSSIIKSVDDSYLINSRDLMINYRDEAKKPKKMIYSSIMAKFGLSGYFGPFFSEVNLNSKLLPMDYAFSLAHEVAHKTGIANEAEANFVSYVVCNCSGDLRLRYSANIMVLIYFLSDAHHLHDYSGIVEKVDKRVMDDLYLRRDYYEGLQNKTLEKVSSAANDAYLKANNIKTGIKNYNQVVALILSKYHNSAKK